MGVKWVGVGGGGGGGWWVCVCVEGGGARGGRANAGGRMAEVWANGVCVRVRDGAMRDAARPHAARRAAGGGRGG
jgi:hypothetical protein